jgi:hypothetical protein
MLADILPSYHGDTDQLDLVKLYDIFIDQLIDKLIEREEEKQSRLAFSAEQRRLFLRRFAYWLWTAQPTDQATVEMLPDDLISPFVRDADLEATRRDLIVGSPLERRPGERIRFPHRAFQEFLVAEELWVRLRSVLATDAEASPRERAARAIADAQRAMTREVSDFMVLLRSHENDQAVAKLLATFAGEVSARVAETLFVRSGTVDEIVHRHSISGRPAEITPWELLTLAMSKRELRSRKPLHYFAKRFAEARTGAVDQLHALYCLLLSGEGSAAASQTGVTVLRRILAGHSDLEKIYAGELRDEGLTEGRRAEREILRKRGQGQASKRRVRAQAEGAGVVRTLRPLSTNMIISGHARSLQSIRVGVCTGRARLIETGDGKYDVAGGATLRVRWMPDWGAELLIGLRFQNDGVIGFEQLASLFARALGPVAFLEDWQDTISRGGMLPVTSELTVGASSYQALTEAKYAGDVLRDMSLRGSTV